MSLERPSGTGSTPVSIRVWTDVSLRRSGTRPLRFRGVLLAEAGCEPTGPHPGHYVALYEVVEGGFVVANEIRHAGCDVRTASATHVASVVDVARALEAFDPRERLSFDVSLDLLSDQASGAAVRDAIDTAIETVEAGYRATIFRIIDNRGGRRDGSAFPSEQGG
jgi:hypothetical protein